MSAILEFFASPFFAGLAVGGILNYFAGVRPALKMARGAMKDMSELLDAVIHVQYAHDFLLAHYDRTGGGRRALYEAVELRTAARPRSQHKEKPHE